jgi:hypothetical protein
MPLSAPANVTQEFGTQNSSYQTGSTSAPFGTRNLFSGFAWDAVTGASSYNVSYRLCLLQYNPTNYPNAAAAYLAGTLNINGNTPVLHTQTFSVSTPYIVIDTPSITIPNDGNYYTIVGTLSVSSVDAQGSSVPTVIKTVYRPNIYSPTATAGNESIQITGRQIRMPGAVYKYMLYDAGGVRGNLLHTYYSTNNTFNIGTLTNGEAYGWKADILINGRTTIDYYEIPLNTNPAGITPTATGTAFAPTSVLPNAALSSLTVNGITVLNGSVMYLPQGTTSVTVAHTTYDPAATVTVLGATNLTFGKNTLIVEVYSINTLTNDWDRITTYVTLIIIAPEGPVISEHTGEGLVKMICRVPEIDAADLFWEFSSGTSGTYTSVTNVSSITLPSLTTPHSQLTINTTGAASTYEGQYRVWYWNGLTKSYVPTQNAIVTQSAPLSLAAVGGPGTVTATFNHAAKSALFSAVVPSSYIQRYTFSLYDKDNNEIGFGYANEYQIANGSNQIVVNDGAMIVAAGNNYKMKVQSANHNTATIAFIESPFAEFTPITVTDAPPAVCFLGDAPVLTPRGYRPIREFRVGDLVTTAEGREVAVKRVFHRSYGPSASTNPYVIPKGFLGCLRPIAISPNHEVLIPGRGMMKAKDLGLRRMKMAEDFTYYNLELEDWVRDNLVVGGVVVESLAPAGRITMTKEEFGAFVKARYGPAAAARLRSVCFAQADGKVSLPAFV